MPSEVTFTQYAVEICVISFSAKNRLNITCVDNNNRTSSMHTGLLVIHTRMKQFSLHSLDGLKDENTSLMTLQSRERLE